jgi:hypothetical protein
MFGHFPLLGQRVLTEDLGSPPRKPAKRAALECAADLTTPDDPTRRGHTLLWNFHMCTSCIQIMKSPSAPQAGRLASRNKRCVSHTSLTGEDHEIG